MIGGHGYASLDDFDEPVGLRAAWCILRVYENGMSGAYVSGICGLILTNIWLHQNILEVFG